MNTQTQHKFKQKDMNIFHIVHRMPGPPKPWLDQELGNGGIVSKYHSLHTYENRLNGLETWCSL